MKINIYFLFILLFFSCQEAEKKKEIEPSLEEDAKKVADIGCRIETLKDKTYDTEGGEKQKAKKELEALTEEGYTLFGKMLEKYDQRTNEFQTAYQKAAKACKYPVSELKKGSILISDVGEQPSISASARGEILVVFGSGSNIFYSCSNDSGKTFSGPEAVETIDELMLGRGMGPQIASTKDLKLITAINGEGNICFWKKADEAAKWSKGMQVNKAPNAAEEGLMAVAGDPNGSNIIVVWLDTREKNKAKVYGTFSTDAGNNWSEKLIYESPGGSVCPCCKPNVLIDGQNIFVMFRNNIKGSRDLYLVKSSDGGRTFGNAQKSGSGTWQIDGCPMDGGGIALSPFKDIVTAWKRKNEIFLSRSNLQEQKIGEGWLPSVVFIGNDPIVIWSNDGNILLKSPSMEKVAILGQGGFPKAINVSAKEAFVIWESGNGIVGRKLN